jgi:hypothetical protein
MSPNAIVAADLWSQSQTSFDDCFIVYIPYTFCLLLQCVADNVPHKLLLLTLGQASSPGDTTVVVKPRELAIVYVLKAPRNVSLSILFLPA